MTFHIVTYTPIFHGTATDPDDAVDLGNTIRLAASEKLAFSFGGTPSGDHLFTMIQSGTTGLVATPETEVVKLHISQGGGPTTLGLFNQMIDPTETLVVTFVTNPNANFTVPNLSQGEADAETNILFGGLQTISGGSVTISQTQGNDAAGMRLTASIATGTTESTGNNFIAGYADDGISTITAIRVKDGSGTLLLSTTTDVTTPVNGITVDFRADGTVDVLGLEENYTVEYDAGTHQRLKITGLAGKFDVGGIGVETPGSASAAVGQQIVIEDDGPGVSANATALLDDDALTGGNAGGTGDDTNAANTSGTLGHDFGTDGAGSIAFLTTGAPSGFTYQLSGSDLLVKQGSTTVLTVTLNAVTGAYTVTQNNPILHTTGLDENNQAFTITYRVTDADGDTADGTLGVNVDDDTPTTSANLTALLDDDALTGGNAGGTGDDADASNTSGTLGHSYGADGAGSIAFLTTGAPSGFTYQLSGSDLLVKQGSTTVLTVTLNAVTGAYTVTQNNPILHATGLDENNQAFTIAYQVTDADGDTANGTLGINVDDDTPLIGPISDGLVDFADGDSVTNPLNGLVGADGPATYSVTSSPATLTIFDGTSAELTLLRDISGNGTVVTYYDDADNSGTLNAGDTSLFKLTVTGGNYTFEVLEDPPPAQVNFTFDGTPSGNHLFTMVQSDGSGLVATPETEVIKLHISQGGGPTTLGVFNQMIDPNETMMFTFLNSPNSNFTVPNLSQGESDLETNILFGDVKTITGGEVAISQTQGNDPAGMRLTAYNTKGDGSATEPSGDGFINGYTNDPIAAISEVRIFDDTGTLLLTATGDVSTPVNGITVDFLASGEVEVRGLEDDYFIEYDADSHERLKVTGLEGKFDIGRVGISQTQPAPDEALDFTVQITDADGDTASDSFSIGIDGTGIFDDNHVDGVIA